MSSKGILWLFGAFIFCCSAISFKGWLLGSSADWVPGFATASMAVISFLVMLEIGSLIPKPLTAKCPKKLQVTDSKRQSQIFECRGVEETLREKSERLAVQVEQPARMLNAILSASLDHIYVFDRAGKYIYVSPAGAQLLGIDPTTLLGKTWQESTYPKPEIVQLFDRQKETAFMANQTVTGEAQLTTVNGVRDYEYVLNPIHSADAQVEAVVATVRDITEHKHTETALRQYTGQLQQALEFESMLKRITDKVRDSLDESQILQTTVQELGRVLGVRSCNAASYDQDKGTSTICYEYTTSIFVDQGRVIEMDNFPELYRQLLQGQYLQFCSIAPHPIRGRVAMLACPIVDNQGALGDLWLVNDKDYAFKDLELRLMQQVANQCAIAIRQARLYQEAQAQVKELEKVNQLKDDFLSTVSHELRTPMSNIKMAIRMLEVTLDQGKDQGKACYIESPLESEELRANRYFQILKDECEREISLINDLLDLQRLESHVQPLHLDTICLDEWIPQITEAFQVRVKTRQQGLQLDLHPELPPLVSDRSILERILAELLNNACKYTPPGEQITVKAGLDAGGIQVAVINSGAEIASEELPRIFEKFYRVPNKDRWKQSGTGLGLTLVKKLTEHLGGAIQVSSTESETIFTLNLPLISADDPAEPEASPPTLVEAEHS